MEEVRKSEKSGGPKEKNIIPSQFIRVLRFEWRSVCLPSQSPEIESNSKNHPHTLVFKHR